METSNDKSYEELLQKISYLQKKVDPEGRDRSRSLNEPRSQLLADLSRRYGDDSDTSLRASLGDISTREKFSSVFGAGDSKFLDDFFGVRKLAPAQERSAIPELGDFKTSITTRFEQGIAEAVLPRFSVKERHRPSPDVEWADFKAAFSPNYFTHRRNPAKLWDSQTERPGEQSLKNLLEFLHSKVRLMNLEPFSPNHLRSFLDFDAIQLPSSQKNLIRAAVEVINFLVSNNLNLENRNTLEYDSKLIDFGLKYFSRNFQEFLASFSTSKPNFGLPRIFQNDFTTQTLKNISSFYLANSRHPASSTNDIPKWFIIYNLMRVGDYEETISTIESLSPNYHILTIPLKCLNNGSPITFKNDETDDLQNLARLSFKNSNDAYEKLIVALLTFSQIETSLLRPLETVEEFVWFKLLRLKLSMLLSSKTFNNPLLMIQEELEGDFENQDSKTTSNSLIFSQSTCLFIVGDFEKAIQHLNHDKIGLVYSIHLAILFFNGNLLRACIGNHKPLLLVNEGEIRSIKINIGYLLTYFFHNFYHILEIFVLDYFIAFKNIEGNRHEVFSLASKLLIDKFSNFDQNLMLQWLDGEGMKPFSQSYMECANSLAEYCSSINEDSISLSLYVKIDKLDKIMESMTELLTQLISSPNAFSPETIDELEKLAADIGDRVLIDQTLDNNASSYFLLLLDLTLFFRDIRNNRYSSALKIANQLQIIPSNYSQIQKCLEKISTYPRKFRLIYRHILFSVVSSIQKIYEISKYETGKLGIQEVNTLREQASALLSFTAQLPFPMSNTTRTKILSTLADLRKLL